MGPMELIGDAIALCMCLATVLVLARERARERRCVAVEDLHGVKRDFRRELRELTGWTRASVKVVEKPETGISAGIKPDPESGPMPLGASVKSCSGPQPAAVCEQGRSDQSISDRYEEVRRMADMGYGAEVIYEKVALPRGEIDLILKLKQLRPVAKENVGAGITVGDLPRGKDLAGVVGERENIAC